MVTLKGDLEEYSSKLSKFSSINPINDDLKNFDLELLEKDSTFQTYKIQNIILIERFSSKNLEFYPLSNNEILSVLHYYNIFNIEVNILHYSLTNVQGFTNRESLHLKISSTLCLELLKVNLREAALFTLLHEISHILGNFFQTDECEKEADRFATQELLKWEKIINFQV